MNTSDAGLKFIATHEGLRTRPYNDPSGYCTVGIGHLIGKRRCTQGDYNQWGELSEQQVLELFRQDVPRYEEPVNRLVTVALTQNQFDVLVSFAFNVGAKAFRNSTLLRKLNQGDYAGAANEFARWNKSRGRMLSGLTRRRAEEAAMFRTGEAPPVRELMLRPSGPWSQEVEAMMTYLRASGVLHRITSAVRSELPSRHAQQGTSGPGLAIDAAGTIPGRNTPELLAIFGAFEPVQAQLYELIYSGASYNIKRGQRVPRYALADHWDHVHIAVDKGVFIRWPQGQEDEDMIRLIRTLSGAEGLYGLTTRDGMPAKVGFSDGTDVVELQKAGQVSKETTVISDTTFHKIPTAGVL